MRCLREMRAPIRQTTQTLQNPQNNTQRKPSPRSCVGSSGQWGHQWGHQRQKRLRRRRQNSRYLPLTRKMMSQMSDENAKMTDCYYETKDWRACKNEMERFRECWKAQGNDKRTSTKDA
ncbi:hypothetical protein B0I37DRAFT_202276 [Chaetomium sp. MPI-CAGE-AT-0009]|nr:hypothetical protein B0I37DRAFT_202276 [Chaetomium sp. MPI-CAGE-AT-0009]